MSAIVETLDRADYIVISSNRLQNSIPRNVLSYPVSRHYYEMLEDGRLGFFKLREFTSYPSLFGIAFPDAGEQESWSSFRPPTRAGVSEDARLPTPARRAAADAGSGRHSGGAKGHRQTRR